MPMWNRFWWFFGGSNAQVGFFDLCWRSVGAFGFTDDDFCSTDLTWMDEVFPYHIQYFFSEACLFFRGNEQNDSRRVFKQEGKMFTWERLPNWKHDFMMHI